MQETLEATAHFTQFTALFGPYFGFKPLKKPPTEKLMKLWMRLMTTTVKAEICLKFVGDLFEISFELRSPVSCSTESLIVLV